MSGVIHLTESKPADFPKCQVLLKISIKCFSWYVNFSHHHQFHVSMGYHQLTQKNDLFPVLVDHFLQSNRLNSEDRDTKINVWKKMNVYVPNISCNYIKNQFDSFVCPLHSSWSSYSHFSMWTSDDHESADGKHATEHVICIIMTSSPTVITGSFSAEEKKLSRLSDLIVSGPASVHALALLMWLLCLFTSASGLFSPIQQSATC